MFPSLSYPIHNIKYRGYNAKAMTASYAKPVSLYWSLSVPAISLAPHIFFMFQNAYICKIIFRPLYHSGIIKPWTMQNHTPNGSPSPHNNKDFSITC